MAAPESIGSYSAGCLSGAVLVQDGPGFQLMRPSRRRFFAHPRLAAYLRRLGGGASDRGLGVVLVGDLAQARGGPSLSGHASHQTGLDADVWFKRARPGQALNKAQRERISAPLLVIPDFERLTAEWDPKNIDLLELAASDAQVDRIFINPVIKRAACEARPGAAWLGKLSPWWGHDNHFHVRLLCGSKDAACRPTKPLPPGDGCGDALAWWFTPAAQIEARRMREKPGPTVMPVLPERCESVLKE